MSKVETLYCRAPIPLQNLMCTIKGYQNNYYRYGLEYKRYRDFLKSFDKLTPDQQEEYQIQCFEQFVSYARENSPYYFELYNNIDVNGKTRSRLPILKKEELRTKLDQIVTISKDPQLTCHTGGTTGKAVTVYVNKKDFEKSMAMLDHFKARIGFENRKMKRASFSAQHIVPPNQKKNIFWRYNHACKQMIYSAYHVSEITIPYYIESLNKFQPVALDGYPSCMKEIADYIQRNNVHIGFHPKYIFTTSETLFTETKNILESVFCSQVYDQYASSEGAPFITECQFHRLHVEPASGVIDENPDGGSLMTCFYTHGTPLIRYEIGDRIVFSTDQICKCGRSQLVDRIEGRTSDFLYGKDKAKIFATNVANITKGLSNSIIQAQYIQREYNQISVLLKVDHLRYTEDEERKFIQECAIRLGKEIKIDIQIVDEIPKEKSGKTRLVINDLA